MKYNMGSSTDNQKIITYCKMTILYWSSTVFREGVITCLKYIIVQAPATKITDKSMDPVRLIILLLYLLVFQHNTCLEGGSIGTWLLSLDSTGPETESFGCKSYTFWLHSTGWSSWLSAFSFIGATWIIELQLVQKSHQKWDKNFICNFFHNKFYQIWI